MAYGTRVAFEAVREVAFGGIGAAYAAIGTGTLDHTRLFTIHNTTDKDIYLSFDGVVNFLRIAAGSARVFDLTTNKVRDDGYFLVKNTIFYQKRTEMGAPTLGRVWIEVMYAEGGV